MEYTLNKIEGFNPEKYIEEAKNSKGETIPDKNGNPLRYLSTAAKVMWFRRVYPAGRLSVQSIDGIEDDFGTSIRYMASVYDDKGNCLAEWQHQETVFDLQEIDQTISKVQTIALGKALSKAGFGCEIELMLGLDSVEDEISSKKTVPEKPAIQAEPEKPKSKRGRKKKIQPEETASKEKTDEIDTDERQVNLIADIDELLAEADEKAEVNTVKADVDPLKKALETVIVCNENANVSMKSLEGKTIEEVLSTRSTFCDFIKSKENIRSMLSKETVEAALYVADNQ